MNNFFDIIARWIAAQLDKLKVKSQFLFLTIQGIIAFVALAFINGQFHVDTPDWMVKFIDLNTLLVGLFMALMAVISPRTSVKAAEFKEIKAEKLEEKAQSLREEAQG